MPERLVRLLRGLSADGRDERDAKRSIEVRARDMETIGVRLRRNWEGIERTDFKPLQAHYAEQTAQIHVVAEYARLGVDDIHLALRLAVDYFRLANNEFVDKWFKGKEASLRRDTLPEHYEQIVKELGNRTQEQIVTDDRERTNVLVLAGPSLGKTWVLVHRIAYLKGLL